jgi:hypothetical protein
VKRVRRAPKKLGGGKHAASADNATTPMSTPAPITRLTLVPPAGETNLPRAQRPRDRAAVLHDPQPVPSSPGQLHQPITGQQAALMHHPALAAPSTASERQANIPPSAA